MRWNGVTLLVNDVGCWRRRCLEIEGESMIREALSAVGYPSRQQEYFDDLKQRIKRTSKVERNRRAR